MLRILFILLKAAVIILLLAVVGAFIAFKAGWWSPFSPTATSLAPGLTAEDAAPSLMVIAEGLDIPWDVAFLPDGDILVTERPGTLKRIGADGSTTYVPGVAHVGEGGLLGIALHPAFADNGWLYLAMTTKDDGGLTNRIVRYRYADGGLHDVTIVLSGIPGAQYHDGGQIAFGPDGKLYATTGDAGVSTRAQDTSSLGGKILRLNDDGSIPDDNPFGNAVWSYGHRNPQGIAWDAEGGLWSTEHGRSGVRTGMDELNRIEKGKNYGWPDYEGDAVGTGIEPPKIHSGQDETWAPASLAILDGYAYFGGLRGETLYRVSVHADGTVGTLEGHLREEFGRLRAVVVGPDGALYVTTSNRDGRGSERDGDDRLLRIDPAIFDKEDVQ